MLKYRFLLPLIFLLVFSCKNDAKKESKGLSEETEVSVSENTDEGEPEIDMGDLMNVMGDIMTGGGDQDSTEQGLFKAGGKLNIEYLKSEEGRSLRKTFAEIAEVTEEEVDLSLTLIPDNNIVSVKHAEVIEENLSNPEVEAYVQSGRASQNFLDLIEESRVDAKKRTSNFKERAQKAKEKFYKDNPSWFALDETTEDTFIDSRKEMVYLPLGNLSFADSIVSFQPGRPEGRTPEKGLGPAQGDANARTDCAVLGIEGILTIFFKDNAILDVNGPDIYVFEIGKIEPTNLEISKNGQDWINVGKIEGGTAFIDIKDYVKPGETFNYVRFTDLDTQSGQPGADIDAVAAIGGALRLNLDSAVLFETGKYQLKEEGIAAIKDLAEQMKNLQKGTITVEGHTDDTGGDEANKTLSQKRAASVAAELKKAIDNPKFKWKEMGYGESRPLVANDSDENRQKNRRVEILVTPY
ncbi:MAG: OmpA family protein [Flavobacteriaceae bacterium]|nr:OmpA family protein [Flavobacteriaceae bacterium]MDH3795500.1 OmpA family protein [Flavobacteriaceae bacterium]